ncbi:MAG TPA: hypothetical protein VMU75_01340 [Acidimicrobiales bacterium]|nr:hypothetical protein [Acidimicrobiales bacterium]
MKARSASVSLYHMAPGHHRETCIWHDADHKAEVLGSVPNVFVSQRWVTPPGWMAVRPPTDLLEGGGEYVNIYWSSGTPEELSADFERLGADLTLVGRMDAVKYMEKVWPPLPHGALRPVLSEARPGVAISGEAVTASTANTGLVTVIGELSDETRLDDFARWHEGEHIPRVLETELFTGAAKLVCDEPGLQRAYVTLYYTDDPSPVDVYSEFSRLAADWLANGGDFPGGAQSHRTTFQSVARPSIGHYDLYE